MRLAVVGYGTIAGLALKTVCEHAGGKLDALTVLAKRGAADRARAMIDKQCSGIADDLAVVETCDDLIARKPQLVAEAAGQGALFEFGPRFLEAGFHLLVTSVGALADPALRNSLDAAAHKGGSRYDFIPGAVGGLDILAAARLAGLNQVTYVSRKPPKAWKGTQAEKILDLDALSEAATFFEGRADDAARTYPQNANVAATIALAGAGFDATNVHMVADPTVARNVHELSVKSACADFTVRIEGYSAPSNPKTSLTTAYSLANAIMNGLSRP